MTARRLFGAAAVVTVVSTAALVGSTSFAAAQDEETVTLSASGSGDEEIPAGSGEKNTDLTASLQLTPDGKLTYTVKVTGNSETINAAHIHNAPKGKNGDVVVPLDEKAVDSGKSATTTMDEALAKDIIANPEDYYINTHSASFKPPTGVGRGQLTADAEKPDLIDTGNGGQSAAADELSDHALLAAGALLAAAVGGAAVVRRRRGASDRV